MKRNNTYLSGIRNVRSGDDRYHPIDRITAQLRKFLPILSILRKLEIIEETRGNTMTATRENRVQPESVNESAGR